MRNVGGTDHDLGRYAADVDAGAADSTALDQRDFRALLDGLQRRRHCSAAATDHGDLQLAFTVDRKSTRLNSSHSQISYAVFCLKKKKNTRARFHWRNVHRLGR